MTPLDALPWIAGAIGLITFLGAAVVFLSGSKDKGTIETLEKNNAALDARVKLLEPLIVRVTALESENRILKENLGAAQAINDLALELHTVKGALDSHHTDVMARSTTIHDDLIEIRDLLRGQRP